jgi:hypothetical protein
MNQNSKIPSKFDIRTSDRSDSLIKDIDSSEE